MVRTCLLWAVQEMETSVAYLLLSGVMRKELKTYKSQLNSYLFVVCGSVD